MKVLSKDGFVFHIWPNDHRPAHTHIFKAGTEVELYLGTATARPHIKKNKSMDDRDVVKALRITIEHQEMLLEKWREIHGDE